MSFYVSKQLDITEKYDMFCENVLYPKYLIKRCSVFWDYTHYNVIVNQMITITFLQVDIIDKFNFKQPHTYIQ